MATEEVEVDLSRSGDAYDVFIDESESYVSDWCESFNALNSYTVPSLRMQQWGRDTGSSVGHYHYHQLWEYSTLPGGSPGDDYLEIRDMAGYGIWANATSFAVGSGWSLLPGTVKLRVRLTGSSSSGFKPQTMYVADVRDTAYNWDEGDLFPSIPDDDFGASYSVPWSAFGGFSTIGSINTSGLAGSSVVYEISLPDSFVDDQAGKKLRFLAWDAAIANFSCKAGVGVEQTPSQPYCSEHRVWSSRVTVLSPQIVFTRTDVEQPETPPDPDPEPEDVPLGVGTTPVRVYWDGS